MENYKFKKKRIIFESIYKNGWKTVIKLGDIKTEKTNLSQCNNVYNVNYLTTKIKS